jgi:hypothetical protein
MARATIGAVRRRTIFRGVTFRDANAQRIKISMTVALLQQPGADHEQALRF